MMHAENLPVLTEADLGAESFVAKLAGEGSFATVRPPRVHFQAVRGRKHFITFYARVYVRQTGTAH